MTKYSKQLDLRRLFDSRAQDFSLIINEYWLERSDDILNLWQSIQGQENELDAFYELCVCAQALKRQDFGNHDSTYQVLSAKIQQIVASGLKKHFEDLCSFFSGESWVAELALVNEKLEQIEEMTNKQAIDEERIAKYHSRLNALWQEWEDAALMLALLKKSAHQYHLSLNEQEELEELNDELSIAQQWIFDQPKVFTKIGLHISAKAWAMKNNLEDWEEEMYGIVDVYLCVLDACYGV